MSASLVGSEMCIRDRSDIDSPGRGPAGRNLGLLSASTRRQEGMHTDPVSYTHLTLPTICSV
eukprot:12025229-Alexandrium_andersonii.AAC.1